MALIKKSMDTTSFGGGGDCFGGDSGIVAIAAFGGGTGCWSQMSNK